MTHPFIIITQNKLLWQVSAFIACLENHDNYIIHTGDTNREEIINNQKDLIKKIINIFEEISKLYDEDQVVEKLGTVHEAVLYFLKSFPENNEGEIVSKLRPAYEVLENAWTEDDIEIFLKKWQFSSFIFIERREIKSSLRI